MPEDIARVRGHFHRSESSCNLERRARLLSRLHNARCLGDGNVHQLRTQSLEPLSLRLRSSCCFDSLASPSPDNISHLSGRRCNIVQRPRLNALRPPRAPSIVSDLAGSWCRALPHQLPHHPSIFTSITSSNFPERTRRNKFSRRSPANFPDELR